MTPLSYHGYSVSESTVQWHTFKTFMFLYWRHLGVQNLMVCVTPFCRGQFGGVCTRVRVRVTPPPGLVADNSIKIFGWSLSINVLTQRTRYSFHISRTPRRLRNNPNLDVLPKNGRIFQRDREREKRKTCWHKIYECTELPYAASQEAFEKNQYLKSGSVSMCFKS